MGFVLVLSRLIFFINNLKDDTEANFIKVFEDAKEMTQERNPMNVSNVV